MTDRQHIAIELLCKGAIAFLIGVLIGMVSVRVVSAEEPHNHALMGDAGNFYAAWNRPKGNFSGIQHRKTSCCNRQDCSEALETKRIDGVYWVRPKLAPNNWYRVDPSIVESNQEDPRESPDGYSHVCIIGGIAACFVEGAGG